MFALLRTILCKPRDGCAWNSQETNPSGCLQPCSPHPESLISSFFPLLMLTLNLRKLSSVHLHAWMEWVSAMWLADKLFVFSSNWTFYLIKYQDTVIDFSDISKPSNCSGASHMGRANSPTIISLKQRKKKKKHEENTWFLCFAHKVTSTCLAWVRNLH